MAVFEGDQPMSVAVLFSGGASGFRYLAAHDPGYDDDYEVVCAVSSDPDAPGIAALESEGVPIVAQDIHAFYEARDADTGDMAVREAFDERTRDALAEFEPDVVLLSGYMWILTAPVVDTFPVINVHPADLTIEREGERVYAGPDPVYDAVTAGEPATRSSVHFVTATVDAGPILVRSRPFDVHRNLVDDLLAFEADGSVRQYADAHQEWMKWEGDGPAIAKALELLAAGRVERKGGTVRIDGEPGFYDLGDDRVLDAP